MRHNKLLSIFFGLHENNVDLGKEEAGELHKGAKREWQSQGDNTYGVACWGKIKRYKGQPENNRRVVREGNVACLVESFWTLACFDRIDCADNYKSNLISEHFLINNNRFIFFLDKFKAI